MAFLYLALVGSKNFLLDFLALIESVRKAKKVAVHRTGRKTRCTTNGIGMIEGSTRLPKLSVELIGRREARGLSRQDMSGLMGVDVATIARWELGKNRPKGVLAVFVATIS